MLLGSIGMMMVSCEKQQAMIRPEAGKEIAENVGKAEAERFLTDSLNLALAEVARCRRKVETAETANELALAQDDLNEARREVAKVEADLEKVK